LHSVREDSPFLPEARRASAAHFVPGQWEEPVAPEKLMDNGVKVAPNAWREGVVGKGF